MEKHLKTLIDRMNASDFDDAKVISWSTPVPSFGDSSKSIVATLGLNPSNCEFVDDYGVELSGGNRRFHTLTSLGISSWSEIRPVHLKNITTLCNEYFTRNPYDRWFKKLDYLISGTGFSYYHLHQQACHLDLVPYATSIKWTSLDSSQQKKLISESFDILGSILKDSSVQVLILNGRMVVDSFAKETNIYFSERVQPNWTLPRKNGIGVKGISYKGTLKNLRGKEFNRPILILGYNHNIQSSFGVTKKVQESIRQWIQRNSKVFINETTRSTFTCRTHKQTPSL